jgi:lipopolysaccharide export system permease protein
MESPKSVLTRLLIPLGLSIAGALLAAWLVPMESSAVAEQLLGFPDSDVTAHQLRPLILGTLCFLPAIGGLAYALGNTLDRYLSRQFLSIFGLALGSLITIWILLDLSNHLGEARQFKHLFRTMLALYGTQLPAILLMLLPYSLLLSLLYCLGNLSRAHEIVAMIQTGRGLARLSAPLIAIGILCTVLCLGLNYQWAPQAENNKDDLLKEAGGAKIVEASNVLYHNGDQRRLWMVGTFPVHYERGVPLANVEITKTTPDGALESRMFAKSASWSPDSRIWEFKDVLTGAFTPGKPPEYTKTPGSVRVTGWSETPWQLIKPGLPARFLGIPDLNGWLQVNSGLSSGAQPEPYLTQWHYRWAQPFVCLVTVLLAAPLGVYFSRRGAGGSIAVAVVLSAALMFATNVTLSLAEAGTIRPMLGAWLPNLIFTAIALYLFHRRITGRPIYQTIRKILPGGE